MIELVIIGFASWYVAHVITKEHGPFNLFGRVRVWAQRNGVPEGSFAEMVTCIYCVAFWASALLYAIWLTPVQSIVYVFAAACGVLVIDRWINS